MSLNDIVAVTISLETSAPTRVGFGVPLIMARCKTAWQGGARVAEYTSAASMVTAGFPASSNPVKMATACFAQNPKPARILVGDIVEGATKVVDLTPLQVLADTDYSVIVNGTTLTYTSDGTPTLAEICTGIETAIDTEGSLNADGSSGTKVVVTCSDETAPDTLRPVDIDLIEYIDKTPEGTETVAEAVAAVSLINDDWYCLLNEHNSGTIVTTLSPAVEALYKIFICRSQNSDILGPLSTTDIAYALQAGAAYRTAVFYHSAADEYFNDCAWAGRCLPYDPGSITWKFKTLATIPYDTFTETQETTLKTKSCNHYVLIQGLNMTQEGVMAGGEFIDVVRGIDFIRSRLQEYVFTLLKNAPKVPYTDGGVGQVENEVRAVLQLAENQTILSPDPKFTVTVPKVADVSTNDKANRLLPDITFTGTLAGAIHATQISGTISV